MSLLWLRLSGRFAHRMPSSFAPLRFKRVSTLTVGFRVYVEISFAASIRDLLPGYSSASISSIAIDMPLIAEKRFQFPGQKEGCR